MKRFSYIFITLLLFLGFQNCVYADSMSIWANVSTATVGKTVTISVKVDGAGKFKVTSSNSSVLSGGTSEEWLEGNTYTFNFSAKGTGTATITVTAIDAADANSNDISGSSKSVSVKVVANTSSGNSSSGGTTSSKKEYSSDNTLASLSIEGYDLDPTFNKDTLEYKLTVDEVVDKINVNAKANHEKAAVTGTGEVNLSSGENTIEVKVTAENGNEKVYKIIVMVEDQHPIQVKVDKEEFTVVRKNNNLIDLLDGYEETTIKINDQDVVAYYNKKTKVTLVLLKDKDNKIFYYVYNNVTDSYSKYRAITVQGVTLQLLEPSSELENYGEYKTKIGEQDVTIYKIKKTHKVGLVYGTNIKTGNTGYYVYDQSEDTLSKYFDEEVKIYQDKIVELKNYLMIFMGVVAFLVIVFIVVSFVRGKKKRRYSTKLK